MKKKLFTLLTLLLCVCSGAWGENETWTTSSDASMTRTHFTVTLGGSATQQGSGSGNRIKFVKNESNTMTISTNSGETLDGITISWKSTPNSSPATASVTSGTWGGTKYNTWTKTGTTGPTSVTFTFQDTKDVEIQGLTVSYTTSGGGGGGEKTVTSKVLTGINISGSAWDISGLSDNAATITTAYDHVPTVQFVYTINYDDSSSDTGQTEDAVPAKSGDNYVATSTELTTNVTLTFTNITNQYLFNMTEVTGPTENVANKTEASVTANFNGVAGTSASVYNGRSDASTMVNFAQINLGGSSSSWFKATFATALEAGDLITSSNTTQTFYLSATTTKGSRLITFPYVVASEDDLVGKTEVYVWKNSSTGGGSTFTSFTIKRNPKHSVTYSAGTGSGTVPTQVDWPEEGKFTVASGDNLTPPANKLFDCWNDGSNDYAAGATYTMGTSNVTLTAKYKDPNVLFVAGEGSGTMAAQAHDAGDIFNLPNSTFTVPTDCKFVNWLCSVDGQTYAAGAPYTMTNAVTTFTAQYESILGTMLIKAVLTGSTTATITGSVGGTYSGNTQNVDANAGGCKLGSKGTWTGFTLTEGHTLKAGDIVEVKITQRNGSTPFVFYDSKLQTNTLLTTTVAPEPGTYKFVLPEAANGKNGVFLVRGKDNDSKVGSANQGFNPHVEYMSVTRPNSTITLNASGFATFSNAEDFEVVGADAYKMLLTTTSLAGTKVETAIPAGEGILFKGTAGDLVAIMNTTGAPAITGNSLHATTTATDNIVAMPSGKTIFVLDPTGDTFKKYTGTAFVANKAFFQIDGDNVESRILTMTFDDGSTTAISGIEEVAPATMKTRKVVKNGRLVIETANGEYTVSGARVK